MKITEIDWTHGKKYKTSKGEMVRVVGNYLFLDEDNVNVDEMYTFKEIVAEDFTEVIDWSKVAVDTPIWVSQHPEGCWFPAHYCKHDSKGRAIVWRDGKTSHTTTDVTPWNHGLLTDPTKGEI